MKVSVSNSQMALLHSWTFIGINFQASGSAELVFGISVPSNISPPGLGEGVEETNDVMSKRKFEFASMEAGP
jgi:hypothetical protein